MSLLAVAPEEDIHALARTLHHAGIAAAYTLATTPHTLSSALIDEPWDMVLVRPGLPGLSPTDALHLARAARSDLQCVALLHREETESAMALLKGGMDDVVVADDPILPAHMTRLAREAARRREHSRLWRDMRHDVQQWRGMVDNTLLGIFRCQPWGDLVHANAAFAHILGHDDPAALVQQLRMENRSFLDKNRMEHFLSRLSERDCIDDFEADLHKVDGTLTRVMLHARIIRDDNGEALSIEGTMEDIERRKSFEAVIINAKQEWEKTFDSVPDVIIIFSPELRIRRCNKALGRLLGLHPRDLVGRRCEEVLGSGSSPNDACALLRSQESAGFSTGELHLPFLGGDFLVTLSPLQTGQNDEPAGDIVMVAHDISNRKRLESQLRQAQKMEAIGTLAGGIAHDFNNILGVMMGYTEMSLDQADEDSPMHRRLSEVLEAGKRARDIIHQILTMSRQEEPSRQMLSLSSPVRETLRLLRATLPANVDIRVDIEDTAPVLANQSQIQQVVMNLCTNAAHAMRAKGGVLTVALDAVDLSAEEAQQRSLEGPATFARLRVRDTGHGIPSEIRENIFDPFFTTKKPDEGTGMGLALVHGIVTGHGGHVSFTSTAGFGTEFEILLPVVSGPAAQAEGTPDNQPKGGGEVLVVDDEASLALVMGEMLENMGYRADIATSPFEALERFSESPSRWAFVVTDQTMPGMTGLELAAHMLGVASSIRVILCTGFSEGLTEEAAHKAGIARLLYKPVLRADMAEAVMGLAASPGQGESSEAPVTVA